MTWRAVAIISQEMSFIRLDIRLFMEADLYQGFRWWQSWFMAMRNKLNVEADPSQGSYRHSKDEHCWLVSIVKCLTVHACAEADPYQGFRQRQSWFMATRNKLNVEADPSQGFRVPSSDFWHTSGFYMRSNNMTWRAVTILSSLSCEVQHMWLEAKPCQVFRWYVRCPLSVVCCLLSITQYIKDMLSFHHVLLPMVTVCPIVR